MANPNTAAFPTAIATDTTLLVQSDNAFSALTANVTSGQTTLPVANASVFNFPCYLAVEQEIVLCAGPASGNTITNCTRGVNSSTATSHSSGIICYGYIFAYQINQLSAEIKAIESALGINLGNVALLSSALGGNLSGTLPNPTVVAVGSSTSSQIANAVSKAHTQNTDTGTTSNTFQVSVSGPKLYAISTTLLQLANNANSGLVDFQCRNLIVNQQANASSLIGQGSGLTSSTIVAGAAAGTSPTVTITGTDTAGQISITVGSAPSTINLATITFGTALANTPFIHLTPASFGAAGANTSIWINSASTTNWTICTSPALTPSVVYTWNYLVTQ